MKIYYKPDSGFFSGAPIPDVPYEPLSHIYYKNYLHPGFQKEILTLVHSFSKHLAFKSSESSYTLFMKQLEWLSENANSKYYYEHVGANRGYWYFQDDTDLMAFKLHFS